MIDVVQREEIRTLWKFSIACWLASATSCDQMNGQTFHGMQTCMAYSSVKLEDTCTECSNTVIRWTGGCYREHLVGWTDGPWDVETTQLWNRKMKKVFFQSCLYQLSWLRKIFHYFVSFLYMHPRSDPHPIIWWSTANTLYSIWILPVSYVVH